jgi:hypothetical protein
MGLNVNTNSYGNVVGLDPESAAEKAVSVIGQGYNLCTDIRFSACKSRLIQIDNTTSHTRDLVFPSGVVVPNVPLSIKSDKGDCTRFRSDVLTFNQVIATFLFALLLFQFLIIIYVVSTLQIEGVSDALIIIFNSSIDDCICLFLFSIS